MCILMQNLRVRDHDFVIGSILVSICSMFVVRVVLTDHCFGLWMHAGIVWTCHLKLLIGLLI